MVGSEHMLWNLFRSSLFLLSTLTNDIASGIPKGEVRGGSAMLCLWAQ